MVVISWLNQIWVALVLFLVIFFGGNFSFLDYHLNERSFTSESLKLIEENTGLSLSSGSRGLNMFYCGSKCIDQSFIAKVEIPKSSKDFLIKQIEQIKNTDFHCKDGNQLEKRVTWWKPSKITIRIERQFYSKTGITHIWFCQEGERWILYLHWWCI